MAEVLGHSDVNTTRKHYAAMSDTRRRQAAGKVVLRESVSHDSTNNNSKIYRKSRDHLYIDISAFSIFLKIY